MITLKAPAGVTSISHGDAQIDVPASGFVTVSESTAAVLASHGFTPYDGGKIEGASAELNEKLGRAFDGVGEQFDAQGRLIGGLAEKIDELDRKGLFRALKAMGVVASATLTTGQLEEIYEAEAKKRDDAALAAAGADPKPAADGQKPAEG